MADRRHRAATGHDSGTAPAAERIESFRGELLADLPRLLSKAIAGYSRFAADCPSEDPKAYLAYQTGCRAALAHVHLLLDLARWARSAAADGGPAPDAEDLDRLVREAEAALRGADAG